MNGFAQVAQGKDKARISAAQEADRRESAPAALADWEAKIRECFTRRTTTTLDLARLICAARTALPFGEWTRLWLSRSRPFSKRKAEMLVVVGRELRDIDTQMFAHLPAGWSTLYYLARLARPLLNSLIADGTIHPALTLADARSLLARFNGRRAQGVRRPNVRLRLRQFKHFVRATLESWSTAERELVWAELQKLAAQLDGLSRSAAVCPQSLPLRRLPRLGPLNNQT
jgi:hypothetical protein